MITIKLLLAVAMVESSGNINAINHAENAVGAFQIRQCAVDDLNRVYKTNYKLSDFKNLALSRWAFIHYGRIYNAKTPEEYCRIWNGGPNGMKKKATENYWRKVKEYMENEL